ncbi:Calx-beta domain-containing protein [Paractinoplanes atraurantiacus]|uniref:Calx-beta domain-containing protein n=1 Tax=Paractinoplanes atraurantiacus TaxID=1036182 RepID=A0A285JC12_9ACTN|nr:Calx-beta domain-containing protein [Actinoplanes atraurantiacus]SNY56936.1 Calx-beta domain-containing protein [Actinoplanes atraurantiacus]
MRYSTAHAATSGSVPFMLRGPKSVRRAIAVAVAGAIGFMPAVISASPAQAAPGTVTLDESSLEVTEGGSLTFNLTRSAGGAALDELPLTWTITSGDNNQAHAGIDENDVRTMSGDLILPADSTDPYDDQRRSITVNTIDDRLDEDSEYFTITITGSGINNVVGYGTILDNDPAPTYKLVVDDPNPSESAGSVNVTAVLDAPSGKEVTIPVSSSSPSGPGSAKAGQDYTAIQPNTTLTVAAGQTESSPLQVAILTDDLYEEAKQTFNIRGGSSTTVSGTPTVAVNIMDDEEQPEITVAKKTANEGSPLAFDVSLSGPSERNVTASYSTADGPGKDMDPTLLTGRGKATAGADYTATKGTVTFPGVTTTAGPTNTAQTITVQTRTDNIFEQPEDMHVTLADPTVAKLGADSVATGGITDQNTAPVVSLLPVNTKIMEGSSGRKAQTFTVKLSGPAGTKIGVDYGTSEVIPGQDEVAAKQGEDFIMTSGTLMFNPGETQKTFTVDIVGDRMYEYTEDPNNAGVENYEKFAVDLHSATALVPNAADVTAGANATPPVTLVAADETIFSIDDDDAKPTYSVGTATVKEGNDATAVIVPIKLSNPWAATATFVTTVDSSKTTADDSGSAPGLLDYIRPAGTANIAYGADQGYLSFLVTGDQVYEKDEKVTVAVAPTGPESEDLFGAQTTKDAVVTITDDDPKPTVTIIDSTVEEGDTARINGVTEGVAQAQTPLNVFVKGGSVKGSAAASPADYVDPGTISANIPAGALPGTTVPIGTVDTVDDDVKEPAETIVVTGYGVGDTATVKDGVITIAANDGAEPTGPEQPGEAPKPTIMAPATVTGTGPVSITGKVAANATVELWGAPTSGGELAWIANTKASAAGAYSFSRSITQGMRFVTQSQEINSAEVRVTVTVAATLTATSPSKGRVAVIVKSNPNAAGRKVVVQRWTGPNTWTNILVSKANVNGAYTATTTAPSGVVALRAWVEGDSDKGIVTGWSAIVRPTIK